MHWLGFHDPVSAWTHGAWFLLVIPATLVLLIKSRGNLTKQIGFLVFGIGLFVCYGGSTLWHTFHKEDLATLDYIGIFLLIAGTTTAVVLIVLQGTWRVGTLAYVWLMGLTGIILTLLPVRLPHPHLVYTVLYLGMGWGMCISYFELARVLGHRKMLLVILGGVWYSVGAVFNAARWPSFWPGVFGFHELFHIFVMAGSLTHFVFMLKVLVPFKRPALDVEAGPRATPSRPSCTSLPKLQGESA